MLSVFASLNVEAQYANSVYLNYQEGLSTSGDVLITDMEVLQSTYATFYTAITWSTGYLGIQSEGGTGYVRHVHYSVWDPATGGEADLVWTNNGVFAQRFGGEGTGWEITMPYNWNTNIFYRFCIAVTNSSTNAFYTAYFFDPSNGVWNGIATIVRHDGPTLFSYSSSFIEDFGETPSEARSALFGNCWMETNRTGQSGWLELKTALFQAVNSTPTNYDAEVEGNVFYVGTGGSITNHTPSNTTLIRSSAGAAPNTVEVSVQRNGGNLSLSWPTLPFDSYQIQWTYDLHSWPTSHFSSAVSNIWSQPFENANQFFRISAQSN